jgi:adenylate cyclase
MNPNTCTVCELMFTRVMRARKVTINATVLFADLRGYTSLSETLSPDQIAGLLDTFYDECADAIWEYDGLLNKTIGDAVMAVFNFPIQHDDHAHRAVLAAREIQSRCSSKRDQLQSSASAQPTSVWVSACIRANSASASLASPIATSRPSVPL